MANRQHIISDGDGNLIIECNSSDPSGEDCPQCRKEKEKEMKEWLETHEPFCLLCNEKPHCYICLKKNCEHWMADKRFAEEHGSARGCSKLVLNLYCSNFICKYRFLGWWATKWKSRFMEIRRPARMAIMRSRPKIKRKTKKKKVRVKNGKTNIKRVNRKKRPIKRKPIKRV